MTLGELVQRLLRNWPAKILSVVAAIFLFLFYTVNSLEELSLTVPLSLRIADGYLPSTAYSRSVRVTIRGDHESLNRILEEDIEAVANYSAYEEEGEYTVPIELVRRGSARAAGSLEFSVEPRELTLVLDRRLQKSVEVIPRVTGYPRKGFVLVSSQVNPGRVQVEGPRSRLEQIESVTTEVIDLSGRSEDFVFRALLELDDPFHRFPGGGAVEFIAVLDEIVVTEDFEQLGTITLNLDAGLEITSPLPSGTILLRGGQLAMDSIVSGDLFLGIDCSEILQEGEYIVPTRPEVPEGITILNWTPTEVVIQVAETDGVEE